MVTASGRGRCTALAWLAAAPPARRARPLPAREGLGDAKPDARHAGLEAWMAAYGHQILTVAADHMVTMAADDAGQGGPSAADSAGGY